MVLVVGVVVVVVVVVVLSDEEDLLAFEAFDTFLNLNLEFKSNLSTKN